MTTSCLRSMIRLAIIAFLPWSAAFASPYTPADDDEVLQRLDFPLRVDTDTSHTRDELRNLRNTLDHNPDDPVVAAAVARRYIEFGVQTGDPRYHGYAQAALRPWWQQHKPPESVLILRATLRQNRHDFQAALDDLDQLLLRNPVHVQAWLTKAVVQMVRGEYSLAERSCRRLAPVASSLLAVTCIAATASLNGRAAPAYALLNRALRHNRRPHPSEYAWTLTVLADVAMRLGDMAAAERHFTQALATGSSNTHLLSAYSDFLLDQGRAQEVHALLTDRTRVDALLLRLAIAEKMLDSPGLHQHMQALRARFAAIRLRGDEDHLATEARFHLQLERNPARALELAVKNWNTQKQPSDALLLLRAALADANVEAVQSIRDWLATTSLQDVRLDALIEQAEVPAP